MAKDAWIGQDVNGYVVQGRIASGGMGVVYRAHDRLNDRDVALKVLNKSLTEDESIVKRFKREARIAKEFDHPRIVPLLSYGEHDEQLYMVMRLMNGGSLSDYIRLKKEVPLGVVARWMAQVSEALDYTHAQGVIHRDIKPANLLMDENGDLFLGDFGVARLDGGTALTGKDFVPGTAHYISPEQATGSPNIDHRSDIYSLAVVAFVLCAGDYPFDGDSAVSIARKHMMEPPPMVTLINPDLPEALNDVLTRGLAKTASQRFDTTGEFAAAFAAAVGGISQQKVRPALELHRMMTVPSQETIKHYTGPTIQYFIRDRFPLWQVAVGVMFALGILALITALLLS